MILDILFDSSLSFQGKILQIIFCLVAVCLAISIHESFHGIAALAMGDGAEGDHEVDLWDLDAAEPPVWNAARRTVEATFRNRNRGRERRRLSLVRYSSDVHDRTYFDLAASPSSPPALDAATE